MAIALSTFMKFEINSCEIEDFVETNLCKLCVVLRSRVPGVLCGLMQGIQSEYDEEDKI